MAIDHDAVALDGIDHMRRRVQAFIRDCCIECREIDRPYRLRPEHEWIIPHTVTIDLRFHRELAEAIEARLRTALQECTRIFGWLQPSRLRNPTVAGRVGAGHG